MKIKVINPNTTLTMTAKIGEAAAAVASSGTEVIAVSPAMGPASIEGHYDEAVSALGVLDEVRKGKAEGCDGYLIACFDDPGLQAAREIADGPVVGISMIGARVGELVGEAQLITNWEAFPDDVAPLIHAHPTQGEALGEAHLALAGKPLHVHQ